ncbi:tannase/feruloyl esterase family alpha/beta hydrolase [Sphingomonas canadensis]|uniref:Tannase/feruloyl esterase family alpha/beta hydrolase n=1 Tax=Sphingomonas canadensis TaxID=1219257 RepID=A0ABW3HAQ6_9SPHN|nr:tannase/feruloyl esterase family alpha/beta hydrolase [Sphingomonas canadensis]MCW3838240.1 tannase/feruloyl esterase family alpha/beta hydrolase [Sphingomonas canadensis]
MRLRWLLAAAACWIASPARADDCSPAAIGRIAADAPVAILSAAIEQLPEGAGRYCLVRVRVGGNVNIAIGLPMDGRWNGRLLAGGAGGYAGQARPPVRAVARGYAGVETDTGHPAGRRDLDDTPADDWRETSGAFAMRAPGVPDIALREDFAHRSAHLMAVVARQVVQAFYGSPVRHAYWSGCSTQGSHGLRAARQHPEDYDGILAGDPAIHFGQVMAFQLWPQVVMKDRLGGPMLPAKLELATARAVAACDMRDGLADGILTDPRRCRYRAAGDRAVVRERCAAGDGTCLSPVEAGAIDAIWRGPEDGGGKLLWRGIERGAPLGLLAGTAPFPYAVAQPRYWVYLDPAWDWRGVTIGSYPEFFARSVAAVNPVMAADDPDLDRFFARGGRVMLYHGFNDAGILPHGSIAWYEAVARRMRLSRRGIQSRMQLYLFPGTGHCGGGEGAQPPVERMLDALVDWVEKAAPPQGLTAERAAKDGRGGSRPVCAYPALPYYRGRGDPALASSFRCR